MHGEKPTFSEKGIWPLPVIFTSSAKAWPLLLLAQNSSEASTYKSVKGTKGVMVRVLEVAKPTLNDWIKSGYDFLDAVVSASTGLQTDFILKLLKTL